MTGQYKDGSIFKDVLDLKTEVAGKANASHTHNMGDIDGLASDVATAVATGVNAGLSGLTTKVAALESWREKIKAARLEVFKVVTNSSGDFTVTTSVAFTNPVIQITPRGTAGAEGFHAHISGITGATITGRAFKNKTQGVLIGGTIDPDEAVAANTEIHVLVIQPE